MKRLLLVLFGCCMGLMPARATDLIGHGGPVRALQILPDGSALTASFDSTVIRWSLAKGQATQVLRFHNGPVNALALFKDGRFASAGEDGRIAVWQPGQTAPETVLTGHSGPVAALAVRADDGALASASWDGTARVWSLPANAGVVLGDHRSNVNGVAFLPDGAIVTAAYDGVLRVFAANGQLLHQSHVGHPVNVMTATPDGEILVGCADGVLLMGDRQGKIRGEIVIAQAPLASLASSPDGTLIAAAGLRGALAIVERASGRIQRMMSGPAFPVWSLAFSVDGSELFTGGANRIVRRWSVATGEPITPLDTAIVDVVPARLRNHPGADVFKACSACHSLAPQPRGGNLAGPTLAGVFGRRIATAPGYDFSSALKAMDIVWTEETIQKLFEIGPAAYTPGTKMPEQKIIRPVDRQALVDFLKAAQEPGTP